jgi:acylphosphatase
LVFHIIVSFVYVNRIIFDMEREGEMISTDWPSGGPSTAQVEKVEVTEEPYTGEFEEFTIRY